MWRERVPLTRILALSSSSRMSRRYLLLRALIQRAHHQTHLVRLFALQLQVPVEWIAANLSIDRRTSFVQGRRPSKMGTFYFRVQTGHVTPCFVCDCTFTYFWRPKSWMVFRAHL